MAESMKTAWQCGLTTWSGQIYTAPQFLTSTSARSLPRKLEPLQGYHDFDNDVEP